MISQELHIDPEVFKMNHEDNERTRLLKDVLRSSVKLQEEEVGKKTRKVNLSEPQAAPKSRKDRKRRSLSSAVNMRELANCQETDLLYMGMSQADDHSLQLLHCGSRISSLYKRLQDSDLQLRTLENGSEAQYQGAKSEDQNDDIRIVNRPEDENPRTVRARQDRAAYDFVSKHAYFQRLEELQEDCNASDSIEALRQIIPRRHSQHPNLGLLDNKVLTSPEKLRKAIWSPPPATTDAKQMANSLRHRKTLKCGNTTKARINLAATAPTLKREGVGMRSAPALL